MKSEASRSINDRVSAEQLRLLYASTSSAVPAIIAVAGVLTYLFWGMIPKLYLLGWIACMFLVAGARLAARWRFEKPGSDPLEPRWARLYILLAGLTGLGWGAAALAFTPLLGAIEQLTLTLVMVAYMAGAVTTQFPLSWPFAWMIYPSLLPLLYRHFEIGGAVNTSLAILLVIFILFVQGASARLRHMLVDSLRLGFENQVLAEHLGVEKRQAEKLNKALEIEVKVRRQAESELIEARVEAENANQAKSDFLANVSHEIRTPMNAIVGMAHLALQKETSAEVREYLEAVKRASEALFGVINNILDFARLADGRLVLQCIEFRPQRCFDRIDAILRPQAQQKGLAFSVDLPDDLPIVQGDPARIEQVLLIVGNNAIKFTEQGGVEISARMEGEGEQAVLHCHVSDTGIGMDAELVERLFEAPGQLDASSTRRFAGTGLGLGMACRLLELMGGRITVDSRPGEGSDVRVLVPLPANRSANLSAPAIDRPSSAGDDRPVGEPRAATAPEAPAGVLSATLDEGDARELLQALREKVTDFDTGAQPLLDKLLQASADEALNARLRDVRGHLQRYDFDRAAELLETLRY